jgi:hypothetical protein
MWALKPKGKILFSTTSYRITGTMSLLYTSFLFITLRKQQLLKIYIFNLKQVNPIWEKIRK